jgi:AcrR family transcriptional regulator
VGCLWEAGAVPRPSNPELPGKILETAEKIVAAEGHHALAMRRLANEVGITPTTLYYYFDSKDHILAQLKLRAAKRLNGRLQRMNLAEPTGALREFARAYVAFAEENPNLYRLFTEPTAGEAPLSRDEQRTIHFAYFAAERVLGALQQHETGDIDPRTKAMEGWMLLHGFVSLLTSGALETVAGVHRDELKKTFFEIYANGMASTRGERGDR